MKLQLNNQQYEISTIEYIRTLSGIIKLSKTEIEYLAAIMELQSTDSEARKNIADKFGVSVEHVHTYIQRLRKRKALNSKNELHPMFKKGSKIIISWD